MLIYEALQRDHLKILALIDELVTVSKQKELRLAKLLVEEIRDELVPHSRAEEAVLYNTVLSNNAAARPIVLHHGFQEHLASERVLSALLAKSIIDDEWTLLAEKFRRLVGDHIAEEESEIFGIAQMKISVADAEMMTLAFEQLKPKVQRSGWMKDALDIASQLMPPRYAAALRTFALDPLSDRALN